MPPMYITIMPAKYIFKLCSPSKEWIQEMKKKAEDLNYPSLSSFARDSLENNNKPNDLH